MLEIHTGEDSYCLLKMPILGDLSAKALYIMSGHGTFKEQSGAFKQGSIPKRHFSVTASILLPKRQPQLLSQVAEV